MYKLDTLYWDRYSLYLDYFKLINKFDKELRKYNVSDETYKIFKKQVAILKTQDKREQYSAKPNVKTIRQIPNKLLDMVLDSFLELEVEGIKNIDIFNKLTRELEISKSCIRKIDKFVSDVSINCANMDDHVRFFEHWNNIKKVSLSLNHNYDTTHGLMLSNLFDIDNKQRDLNELDKPVISNKTRKVRLQEARAKMAERDRN